MIQKENFILWDIEQFKTVGKLDKKLKLDYLKIDIKDAKNKIKDLKNLILNIKKAIIKTKENKTISERMSYDEYVKSKTLEMTNKGYNVIKKGVIKK